MAKRFTDSEKWKNPWFRKLQIKAKLTWVYMCDECDISGVWKPDFELASFQLDFKIDLTSIIEWYGDKVRPFRDCILIVQFFEFQYGDSKDTWSAKVKAKSRLESLGFEVVDNKIVSPIHELSPHNVPTVVPQCHQGGVDVLSKGVGISVGKGISKSIGEEVLLEFEPIREIVIERAITTKSQQAILSAFPDAPWVITEIKKMIAWEAANPSNKKKNFARFATNWLTRSWDKKGTQPKQHYVKPLSEIILDD